MAPNCLLALCELAWHDRQRDRAAALEFDFHGCLQVVDIPDGNPARSLPRFDLDRLGVPIVALIIVQSPELQGISILRRRNRSIGEITVLTFELFVSSRSQTSTFCAPREPDEVPVSVEELTSQDPRPRRYPTTLIFTEESPSSALAD